MSTARKLIIKHKINKVVLVWDGENGGFYRHIIEPAYKANRKDKKWYTKIQLTEAEIRMEQEKEESVLKQRKRIQQYAEELFFRQIEVDKIEADDLIASYCQRYHDKEDILIYTNDRDFAQLLDLDITILFDNIDEPIDKSNFIFKFGYSYKNALIMKVICGDTSDNLKGIDGMGQKTLMKYFPDIKYKKMMVRDICIRANEINQERIANKKDPYKALTNLLENIDTLKTNYELMNLGKPFLNEQAEDELEQLYMPIDDEDRNSKNLFNLMKEDGFLELYTNKFADYVKPFFPVIMKEKEILKEYVKKQKKLV